MGNTVSVSTFGESTIHRIENTVICGIQFNRMKVNDVSKITIYNDISGVFVKDSTNAIKPPVLVSASHSTYKKNSATRGYIKSIEPGSGHVDHVPVEGDKHVTGDTLDDVSNMPCIMFNEGYYLVDVGVDICNHRNGAGYMSMYFVTYNPTTGEYLAISDVKKQLFFMRVINHTAFSDEDTDVFGFSDYLPV